MFSKNVKTRLIFKLYNIQQFNFDLLKSFDLLKNFDLLNKFDVVVEQL